MYFLRKSKNRVTDSEKYFIVKNNKQLTYCFYADAILIKNTFFKKAWSLEDRKMLVKILLTSFTLWNILFRIQSSKNWETNCELLIKRLEIAPNCIFRFVPFLLGYQRGTWPRIVCWLMQDTRWWVFEIFLEFNFNMTHCHRPQD